MPGQSTTILELMRPLPTSTQVVPVAAKPAPVVAAPQTLELGPLSSHTTPAPNRRSPAAATQRAYPWLLVTSTVLSAVFFGLYLTKPVIAAGVSPATSEMDLEPAPPMLPGPATPKAPDPLLPSGSSLPGDKSSKPQSADPRRLGSAASGTAAAYEETNLRVQHVLNARGPNGEDLGKVTLEVPVLYGSRSLRWTPEEVARARALLVRIGDYQEKSRALREEGGVLLEQWNALVGDSIPAGALRADSPSLTRDALLTPAEGLDSSEAIEIQNR
jgi:hypothetical protein